MNSLYLLFVWKVFLSPSFLKGSFARYSTLGWQFSPLSIWDLSYHSLLARKISAEKLLIVLWWFPCIRQFASLLLFLKFSFCLWIDSLSIMYFSVKFSCFTFLGIFWSSWIWMSISLQTNWGEIFNHYFFE